MYSNPYKCFLSLLAIMIFSLSGLIYAQSISISNIVDLQKIGNDPAYPLNGNYVLTQDIDASDTINWNSGAGFKPIGDIDNAFTGNFDGQNHVISGLYINRPSEYVGLFRYISNGVVHNVLLESCNIAGDTSVGALVGISIGGEVRECGVLFSNIEGMQNLYNSVGGLVGSNTGIIQKSFTLCCSVYDIYAQYGTGGLVGYNYGGTIQNSCVYSTSEYITSVTGASGVGGLIGVLSNSERSVGSVVNCYSSAVVMGTFNVGGLIGKNNGGMISSSYWDTTVSSLFISEGGEGKTTIQMRQQTTYVGWDFINIWTIEEGVDYPYLRWVETPQQSIEVPVVTGMTETNAVNLLNGLGLIVNTSYECNNSYSSGMVISQQPESGSVIDIGGTVTIVISTGPCSISIPNVVGMNATEATNLLRSLGITGEIITSYDCNDGIASGTVISQNPTPGTTVSPDTSITFVVSRGPCSVTVPNVVGINEDTAINTILSLNLIENISYGCHDTIPEGHVIYQEPSAGTVVDIDSTVYLLISTGPCVYVPVPDVINRMEADARTILQQAGFSVTIDYECSMEFPAGTVIGQYPEGGTQAIQNSEVYLNVSAGTCPPIEIDTIEELQKIGNDPDYPIYGNYLLTQDIEADVTANWNNGKGFIPIGTWEKPFKGTFDGQNHIIFDLYINNSETDYTGLFGIVTSPAKIKNVIISDSKIIGYYYIGALVGIVIDNECEIVECAVRGCYISGISGYDSVGGFVGGNSGKILRCHAEDISVNGERAEYGIGGFVGLNYGGNITDSFIYSGFVSGNSLIGGLVGYQVNYAKSFTTNVLNCYSVASVSGKMYVGGLVGYNDGGTTVASYWDTTISGVTFSDGGTGKTTAEMYQQATYEGWDFVNTWVSYEGTNYPILKWVVDLSGEGEGSAEGEVPITVPNVTGMTEQQARNALESAGLNRIQVTYNCSNTVAQGNVLSQVPSAGEEISPRVYVQLSISNGLCPGVVVPDVVGRTEQQAKDVIQIADLTVKIERECNNYVAQGFVIRQSPVAYSGVNRKSEITIWVSTGPCSGTTYITVPNVIGQNVTSATGQLQSAGLSVRTVSQYSDTIAQNTVMGQSPVGGTSVISGTTVELIVSAGPDPAGVKISTPRGLQTFSGIDHVYLVWEANTERNLAGYRLERSETRTGPWTTVSTNIITGTNYRDNGVDTSKSWYYRLIAVGTNGQQSDPTEPVKAEPGKLRVWIPQIDWLPEGNGDTIQVPINISSARGLEPYTIDINVSYNNTVLELVEVQQTAVTRNLNVLSPDTRTQGVIKFHAGPRVDNEKKVLYGEGRLFDMVFRARQNTAQGNCSQDTNLTLQRVLIKDKDLKELPVELVHGQLNILEENPNNSCINSRCIYGDLDTDGYIGMSDTIMFLRKIVRKAGITDVECDKRRGDFNGDGILDCADVSLLLRRLAGLPTNPTAIAIGSKALLEIESNRTVEVVLDNPTPDINNEYRTGIELSSLSGVAGMDLVLAYDEGISFSGLSLPSVTSGFKKDTEAGEGYLKVSISSEKPITSSGKGRILQINFKPATTATKTIKIQIREVKVKGEFGDDLSWYGEITTKGTTITTTGAEQFLNDLKTNFNSIDTNNDGKISYEEAVAQYPTLTREAFNSADTNKDGYIDKAEAGVTINEGTVEGTTEGASEGALIEGSVDGSPEGEGEGEGQNGGGNGICGCKKSNDFNDGTWKYLLDFVLVGILMFAMSGMKRKK